MIWTIALGIVVGFVLLAFLPGSILLIISILTSKGFWKVIGALFLLIIAVIILSSIFFKERKPKQTANIPNLNKVSNITQVDPSQNQQALGLKDDFATSKIPNSTPHSYRITATYHPDNENVSETKEAQSIPDGAKLDTQTYIIERSTQDLLGNIWWLGCASGYYASSALSPTGNKIVRGEYGADGGETEFGIYYFSNKNNILQFLCTDTNPNQ